MKSLRQGGLTLIELLVVLSIAVILMALAAPSFNETLRRNRIETAANGLLSALNFRRCPLPPPSTKKTAGLHKRRILLILSVKNIYV